MILSKIDFLPMPDWRQTGIVMADPIRQIDGAMKSSRPAYAAIFLALPIFAMFSAWAQEITGIADVRSANEVVLDGTVVRLFGLEAPATDTRCDLSDGQYRCGVVAWAELVELADGRDLSCDIESQTGDGTPIATCYLGERDINEALVRSGWAEARADVERYQVDQAEARRARRGLWAERIRPPDRRQAP